MVDINRLNKMKLEELERGRALYDQMIAQRKAGIARSYKKSNNSIRIVLRDERVLRHIKILRHPTTLQIARLEYLLGEERLKKKEKGAAPFSVAYAERRLYDLRKAGYVESIPGLAGKNTAWELTDKGFDYLKEDGSEEKRLKRLNGTLLSHLIAVNEVYVLIHELLREEDLIGHDPSSYWSWIGEPDCHRPYDGTLAEPAGFRSGRWHGSKLKPDAEIVLFDEIVVFLERQTAFAKKEPEKIYDRVFEYHAYENSIERRSDKRKMHVLWACDAERDKKAVSEAETEHPTKTLRQFGLNEHSKRRMPVHVAPLRGR